MSEGTLGSLGKRTSTIQPYKRQKHTVELIDSVYTSLENPITSSLKDKSQGFTKMLKYREEHV
jgi:hypothetical protein